MKGGFNLLDPVEKDIFTEVTGFDGQPRREKRHRVIGISGSKVEWHKSVFSGTNRSDFLRFRNRPREGPSRSTKARAEARVRGAQQSAIVEVPHI